MYSISSSRRSFFLLLIRFFYLNDFFLACIIALCEFFNLFSNGSGSSVSFDSPAISFKAFELTHLCISCLCTFFLDETLECELLLLTTTSSPGLRSRSYGRAGIGLLLYYVLLLKRLLLGNLGVAVGLGGFRAAFAVLGPPG